jgi:predicted Zn-dependent protease with MMP-like domain
MRYPGICVRTNRLASATLDNELVIEVDPGRFEEMWSRRLCLMAVTNEHRPGLPGLYEGIPLTSRASKYAGVLRAHHHIPPVDLHDPPHRGRI